MKLIVLRLEGPLQSWGEDAKWDNRPTSLFPTKSGVVSLIACCMGLPREDRAINEISQSIQVGFRADRPGKIFVDFHTVTADKMMSSDGTKKSRTIISPRQYLQDASFLAGISSPDEELLNRIASALIKPVWAPYLGRKSCVPSVPVFIEETEEYYSIEDSFRRIPLPERLENGQNTVVAEIEDNRGIIIRKDAVMSSADRSFDNRRVSYLAIRKEDIHVPFTAGA